MNTTEIDNLPEGIKNVSNAFVRCLIGDRELGMRYLANNINEAELKLKAVDINFIDFAEVYNSTYKDMYVEIAKVLNKYLEPCEG